VLDAPEFFGPDEVGHTRYRKIVAACDRWVAHGLLGRLAQLIQGGSPVFIGATSLTAEGVLFSADSAAADPCAVPYRAIQVTVVDGSVHLVDQRDGRRTATCPLHANWNAVVAADLIEIMAYFQPRVTS
jgi:hypothetical protein